MDELTGIVVRAGFLPHGYCFQWSPGLLWTMVSSDLAIALAYFSLPLVIARYARLRPQVNLGRLAYASKIMEHANGAAAATSVSDRGPIGDPVNQLAAQSTPKMFMCPSARFVPGVRKEQKDYAINGGPNGCCPERNNGTNATLTGLANALNGIRLAEITDGTSNTFLFLEAVHSKNQSWLAALTGSNHFMFVHHPSQGYVQGNFSNLLNPPNDTQFNTRAPASGHPGGVQVTYADGRVAWLSNNVDFFNVYLPTYTRAGGEPLSGQASPN